MNAFITGGVKSQARLGPLMQDTASGCFLVTITDSEGKPVARSKPSPPILIAINSLFRSNLLILSRDTYLIGNTQKFPDEAAAASPMPRQRSSLP